MSLRRALAIALVGLASGCSSDLGPGNQLTVEEASALVLQVQNAPYTTPHKGTRRIRANLDVDGVANELRYVEAITADGLGNYHIDTVVAETPVIPGFETLQLARQGFYFRYRDFLVRDLDQFVSNYGLLDFGKFVDVAGRQCIEYQLMRKGQPEAQRIYTVAIDVTTFLVLRYEERNPSGELLSSMEYLTYDVLAHGSVDGMPFHQPSNQETPIDPSVPVATQLGFEPLLPTDLPGGYRPVKSGPVSLVDDQGRTWFNQPYTDGVETLFFLHAAPDVSGISGPQLTSAKLTGEREGDVVNVYRAGSYSIADAFVRGEKVIVLGKVPAKDLLDLIESAL